MFGGRRLLETVFKGLLLFCLAGRPAHAHYEHTLFNQRILAAAEDTIRRGGQPLQGQSQAQHLQAVARNAYSAITRLPAGRNRQMSQLNFRFGVLVWPWQIQSEFRGYIEYGAERGAFLKRLKVKDGVVPYTICYHDPTPLEDPRLGKPCPSGNSVYAKVEVGVGQWMHCMVFYNPVKNPKRMQDMEKIFQEIVDLCGSTGGLGQDGTSKEASSSSQIQPQIDLTALAECAYTRSSTRLGTYLATFRGMAAIISYDRGRNLEVGGDHDDFGLWNPLGGVLVEHYTMTDIASKTIRLLGHDMTQAHVVSVYFITAVGILTSNP